MIRECTRESVTYHLSEMEYHQLQDLKEKNIQLEKENSRVRRKYDELFSKYTEVKLNANEWSHLNYTLRNKINKLTDELNGKDAEIMKLQQEKNQAESDWSKLWVRGRCNGELSDSPQREMINKLAAENSDLKQELTQHQIESTAIATGNMYLRGRVDMLTEENGQLQDENRKYKECFKYMRKESIGSTHVHKNIIRNIIEEAGISLSD